MLLLLRSKLWRSSGNASAVISGAQCTASAGTLTPVATSTFILAGGGSSKAKLAPQRSWHLPKPAKPEAKPRPEQKPKPQPKPEPTPEPVSISATAALTGAGAKATAARLRAETVVHGILVSAVVTCQASKLYGISSAAAIVDEGLESATSDLMLLELILNL